LRNIYFQRPVVLLLSGTVNSFFNSVPLFTLSSPTVTIPFSFPIHILPSNSLLSFLLPFTSYFPYSYSLSLSLLLSFTLPIFPFCTLPLPSNSLLLSFTLFYSLPFFSLSFSLIHSLPIHFLTPLYFSFLILIHHPLHPILKGHR